MASKPWKLMLRCYTVKSANVVGKEQMVGSIGRGKTALIDPRFEVLHTFGLLTLLLAAWSAETTVACNLCSPMAGSTMLTDLDASNVAFIAELDVPTPIHKNPAAFDLLSRDRQKGEAGFHVRTVLKGQLDAMEDEAIIVPLRVPGSRGTLHLITHDSSDDLWRSYRLSDEGARFAAIAARLPIPAPKNASSRSTVNRLELCLKFLGTDDFLLRRAIFAEFAKAPYSAIKQLRPRLDREMVYDWMQLASRRAEEARLMFLLLSLCGDGTDVPILKNELQECVDSNWAGTLDAVILAYVALGGIGALDDLDQTLLSSKDGSFELKAAAARALSFLVENEPHIDRARLLLSCRLLLNDPATAELIVQDIARWENWRWEN